MLCQCHFEAQPQLVGSGNADELGIHGVGVHGVEHGANAGAELSGPAACTVVAGFGGSSCCWDPKLKFGSALKMGAQIEAPLE